MLTAGEPNQVRAMAAVTFRFYGDLNDFLPARSRHAPIRCICDESAGVKHPIEALGVPHPEVEALIVNGAPADFAYRVRDGDVVDVFPCQGVSLPAGYLPLRPPLAHPIRFVLDTHLGQLAAYLRLLGFDALYRNDYRDEELARIAADSERLLLSRDRGLLKRKLVTYGYCVRESEPRLQVASILRRYRLAATMQPWQRCARCNGLLAPVAKAAILDKLEPKTKLYYEDFQRCRECGQIYWQGSHYEHMQSFIAELASAM